MLFFLPSVCCSMSTVSEHKREFRLNAAGMTKEMDNKLLHDHLIFHKMECFHVCIVDLIRVDNNNTEHHMSCIPGRQCDRVTSVSSPLNRKVLWHFPTCDKPFLAMSRMHSIHHLHPCPHQSYHGQYQLHLSTNSD